MKSGIIMLPREGQLDAAAPAGLFNPGDHLAVCPWERGDQDGNRGFAIEARLCKQLAAGRLKAITIARWELPSSVTIW